jgi:hypothetical protein
MSVVASKNVKCIDSITSAISSKTAIHRGPGGGDAHESILEHDALCRLPPQGLGAAKKDLRIGFTQCDVVTRNSCLEKTGEFQGVKHRPYVRARGRGADHAGNALLLKHGEDCLDSRKSRGAARSNDFPIEKFFSLVKTFDFRRIVGPLEKLGGCLEAEEALLK